MKQKRPDTSPLGANKASLLAVLVLVLQLALLPKLQARQSKSCPIAEVIKSMPDIKTVYDKFYKTYSYNSTEHYPEVIRFARKKDGWWVVKENNTNPGTHTHEQLFWSYALKDYMYLDFDAYKEGANTKAEADFEFYFTGQLYDYQKEPYYGYNGWANDVVGALQNEKKLSDTLLEGLARAYAALGDIRGGRYYIQRHDTALKNKADSIAFYLSNADKQLDTYKRLIAQNPDYKTLVGNVFINYSNESVNTWLELSMYGKPDLAKKYLPKGLYGSTYIDYAKDYLISCADSAILFTNGDNDTYTLLYVQETLGYRKDVSIINKSMLELPLYIKMVQGHIGSAASIHITMPYNVYSSAQLDYVLFEKIFDGQTIDLSEFIRQLSSDIANKNYTDYPTLEAKAYYIKVSGKNSVLLSDLNTGDKPVDTVYIKLDGFYFLSDIIVLDILAQYGNKRPICISYTGGFDKYMNLTPYLRLEGLTYRLTASTTKSFNDKAPTHIMQLYNNLMNQFEFAADEKYPEKTFIYYKTEAEIIRGLYLNTISSFAPIHTSDFAERLMAKMETLFPHGKLPYSVLDMQYLVNIYIALQHKDQAKASINELSALVTKSLSKADNTPTDINESIAALEYCAGLTKGADYKNELQMLNKQIKKLKDKYNITE